MSYPQDEFANHPILGPFLKAKKIQQYLEDMAWQKEQRATQRELTKLHLDEARRQRTLQDFNTANMLSEMGVSPVGANDQEVGAALDSSGVFGAPLAGTVRAQVQSPLPGGGQIYLPTAQQRFAHQIEAAKRTGTIKGTEQLATEQVTNPYEEVSLPQTMGGGTAKVKRGDKVSKMIDIYKAANPNMHITNTTPNDKGQVSILGTNPQTGETRTLKIIENAGKTKSEGAGKEPLPTNDEIEAIYQKYLPNTLNDEGVTAADQQAVAGQFSDAALLPEEKNKIQAAATEKVDRAKKRAWEAATNEAKARIRNKNGSAAIQSTAQPSQATASGPGSLAGHSISASNIAVAARRKGLSVSEFRKQWIQLGGMISEEQ
jgi:hypothetical protein